MPCACADEGRRVRFWNERCGQQAHPACLTQTRDLTAAQQLVEGDRHEYMDAERACVKGESSITPLPSVNQLSTVGKVSKLRLPQDQAVGVLHAVAQLKSQHAKLRERAAGTMQSG